jgi:hypothetical protein
VSSDRKDSPTAKESTTLNHQHTELSCFSARRPSLDLTSKHKEDEIAVYDELRDHNS